MDHHTEQAESPPDTPPPPKRSRAAALAFALAFIVALVAVGVAALVMVRDNEDEEVVDEPITTTTLAAPQTSTTPPTTAAVNSGDAEPVSFVPGLGTLTWTRVDFTAEEFRDRGVLMFDADYGFRLWHSQRVWESDDGMSWTLVDVPTEFADYTVVNLVGHGVNTGGGSFGLASSDRGPHLLLSWQDGAWVEVGQLEVPDTVGITWSLDLGAPIEWSGGVLLAQGRLAGSLPWVEIYGTFKKPGCEVCDPKPPRQRWDSAAQKLKIVHPHNDSVLASLAIEVVGDTATYRDVDTGDVVHEVVGSDEYPVRWLLGHRISGLQGGTWHWRRAMDGIWAGVPGTGFEFHDPGPGAVLAAPDGSGFVAYEQERGPNPNYPGYGVVTGLRTSISADAVTWSEGTAPPFPQPWASSVSFGSGGGEIYALVGSSVSDGHGAIPPGEIDAQFWVSPDGVTWTQKTLPIGYQVATDFGPYPTEFGYVAWSQDSESRYWMSVDGESWIEAAGPAGSHGWSTVAGSTLFWANGTDLGDALWVGRFEP